MEYLPKEVSTVCKADLEHFNQSKRVGSYLLGETIGEGSFAKVKIAIHVSTGEKVAIKIINKKKAREDRYVSRNLKREAEIMQLVRHRNVVRLLEVMETDAFYYLVTELCTGGELLDKICCRKYFDEDTTRKYIQQLISAVLTMHRNRVVHRDLKIENFLLDEDDNLKIVDFGLSNVLPEAALETWQRIGMCPLLLTTHCGSPAYAAPELLAQEPYGAQVDVWSIGVNMFAMLTGNLPYTMEPFSIIDLYHKMMQRKITPFPKRISQGARDLILQLLEPIPQKRITLQHAANHPWLKSTEQTATSCVTTAAENQSSNEINQNVVLHIAENMGMNMKELIASVSKNRATHSSAIYFLLNERLKRYEERLRNSETRTEIRSFSKLKIVRKATLPADNATGPRSRFTYKGIKICKSQPGLQDQDSDTSSTQKRNVVDEPCSKQSNENWNQYATFPRDRHTANSNVSKNVTTIGNASLDRGSDDIDYHRASSPETTDHNSTSSLDSLQALHYKLMQVEGNSLSAMQYEATSTQATSSTGESGSEDDIYNRCRSKSLANSEEYDNSSILFSAYGRNRTASMANCFHHNYIETSPRKKVEQSDSTLSNIHPARKQRSLSGEEHLRRIAANKQKCESNNNANNNKENIREMKNAKVASPERSASNGQLVLKKTSPINGSVVSKPSGKEGEVNVSSEMIPAPTPFKDESSRINVEILETRKCSGEIKRNSLPSKVHYNEVNLEKKRGGKEGKQRMEKEGKQDGRKKKIKDEKTGRRRHVRKGHERTKSLSDIKFDVIEPVNFHKIEVEKVRKIELVPLKSPTMQMAPTLHTVSPFSLNCVKQESPLNFDSLSHQIKVTTEPESKLERTMYENQPGKPETAVDTESPSSKPTPFKVNFVKLAKWQRAPVVTADVVLANNVKKCIVGPDDPMVSTQRNAPSVGNPHNASLSAVGETSLGKAEIKVHRARSCSLIDYHSKLENNNELLSKREGRRPPHIKSRSNSGRILVKKGSFKLADNLCIITDVPATKNETTL
eukprot:gene605-1267_t